MKYHKKGYPMNDMAWCQRSRMTDQFVALCYYLERKGKLFCCWHRKIATFKQALEFQFMNSLVIAIYVFTVPIVQLLEYILEETDNLEGDGFFFGILTRLYILLATIICIIFIQSFSRGFPTTLPFVDFKLQLMSILLLQGSFNILGAIIRITQATIGDYSKFESYQLLFICVYSIILAIFTVLHMIVFKPAEISSFHTISKKMLVVPGTAQEQKSKPVKLQKDSGLSKSNQEKISMFWDNYNLGFWVVFEGMWLFVDYSQDADLMSSVSDSPCKPKNYTMTTKSLPKRSKERL